MAISTIQRSFNRAGTLALSNGGGTISYYQYGDMIFVYTLTSTVLLYNWVINQKITDSGVHLPLA